VAAYPRSRQRGQTLGAERFEKEIRTQMAAVRGRVPDNLVDLDDARRRRVSELYERDGLAGHAGRIDRAVKGDGDARLEIETIERVDDRDIVAIRRLSAAIRRWQGDPAAGDLAAVGNSELVARERANRRVREIEQHVHIAADRPIVAQSRHLMPQN